MSAAASSIAVDGLTRELTDLALSLVLRLPDEVDAAPCVPDGSPLRDGGGATFRLARPEDVGTVCDLRCAQSLEYQGLPLLSEDCRRVRVETEAYLRRNLNTRAFFALVERDGEAVSLSGLEVADRLPTVDAAGGSERAATVVGCYTPPEHRGRGYMRQMLSAWTAMAPLVGIDTLYLESRNVVMQRLARDAGYEPASAKYRLRLVVDPHGRESAPALAAVC